VSIGRPLPVRFLPHPQVESGHVHVERELHGVGIGELLWRDDQQLSADLAVSGGTGELPDRPLRVTLTPGVTAPGGEPRTVLDGVALSLLNGNYYSSYILLIMKIKNQELTNEIFYISYNSICVKKKKSIFQKIKLPYTIKT
jgi:hypothetical protein